MPWIKFCLNRFSLRHIQGPPNALILGWLGFWWWPNLEETLQKQNKALNEACKELKK